MKAAPNFFFSGRSFFNRKLALVCWFGLSFISALLHVVNGKINNFLIFRQVFFHSIQRSNLYIPYPQEYGDVNLYGPVFALVIAPFTLLPVQMGALVWALSNATFLLFAILQLPLERQWKTALILFCSHEMMINSSWFQTNSLVCACLLLGFVFVQRKKEWVALFFILLATFIKVYGIVGLGFFFFSRHKLHFILWTAIWSILLFLAPLLITDFSFLWQTYPQWVQALREKSHHNIQMGGGDVLYQNISVMGMIRRIFYLPQMSDLTVFIPAVLLFLSQGLAWRHFKDIRLQYYLLCSLLLSVVIFSNSAESPTYIIAVPGICLWYFLQPKTKQIRWAFVALLVFTTFAYSDLFGTWLRSHVFRPYSLKALPSFILWIVILVQVHCGQFLKALHPFDNPASKLLTLTA